jgi:hypothetical protein
VEQELRLVSPSHGKIDCTLCFSTANETVTAGAWRFRNDPGHWGSADPRVLVLGFSKGATQANAYDHKNFEDVAFAGARARLKRMLLTLGLVHEDEDIEHKFRSVERDFAFASLVRCSVARWNSRTQKVLTSGPVILNAFREPEPVRLVTNCSRQFLQFLPKRLRLIVMLGIQDEYVNECRNLMARLYPGQIEIINSVAYSNGPVIWVHAVHPSPANGHFGDWISATTEKVMGQKRELAKDVVSKVLKPST